MNKLGESVLRKLSRDPNLSEYLVDHYEERHKSIDACVRHFENLFPGIIEDIKGKNILDVGC